MDFLPEYTRYINTYANVTAFLPLLKKISFQGGEALFEEHIEISHKTLFRRLEGRDERTWVSLPKSTYRTNPGFTVWID